VSYKKVYYIWTMFVAAVLIYVLIFHHDIVSGPSFLSKGFSINEWGELLQQYENQRNITGLRNLIEGISRINVFVIIAVYFIVFKSIKEIVMKKKVKMIIANVICCAITIVFMAFMKESFKLYLSIAAMIQFNFCQCYMLGTIGND
jgi:hypothetical protein